MASNRILQTEQPYIEDVLDKYSHLYNVTNLALGSSYWSPPESALESLKDSIGMRSIQRYGNILGLPELKDKFKYILTKKSFVFNNMEIAITTGANQAFMNVALTLIDQGDNAIIVSPYYFSHLLSLQLCQANITICSFEENTLEPNWNLLEEQINTLKPKLVVITSPNNPSGYVWKEEELRRLVELCRKQNTWIVVDQTYYEFVYENEKHIFPLKELFNYPNIVHIFSFSKTFGMPGWRVGAVVYPLSLQDSMRKIQDTIPTHASMISQQLAALCLDSYEMDNSNPWFQEKLSKLCEVRETLWPILEPLGTVKTTGAFYFLVPLPKLISEEEAVDIMANKYNILLMHGKPFGAPGYLRLSYGSISPELIVNAKESLKNGFQELLDISKTRL